MDEYLDLSADTTEFDELSSSSESSSKSSFSEGVPIYHDIESDSGDGSEDLPIIKKIQTCKPIQYSDSENEDANMPPLESPESTDTPADSDCNNEVFSEPTPKVLEDLDSFTGPSTSGILPNNIADRERSISRETSSGPSTSGILPNNIADREGSITRETSSGPSMSGILPNNIADREGSITHETSSGPYTSGILPNNIADREGSTTRETSSGSDDEEIDLIETVSNFKKKLKRYGLSQRQASKLILNCAQSTLSDAISKAKTMKTSKKLTSRGMEIYRTMDTWTKSKERQKKTVSENAQRRMTSMATSRQKSSRPGKRGSQFTYLQLCVLVELYKKNPRPSAQRKQLISETLNVEEIKITTWFNNQRARNFIAEKQVEKMKADGKTPSIPESWDMLFNEPSQ